MPLLAAEHEVGCVPPKFNRDELRGEKKAPTYSGGGGGRDDDGRTDGRTTPTKRNPPKPLEAFTNIASPFDHIRHDGEHSGFVCTSRLRFGRVFLWCPLRPDTFWLLTGEEVIFTLGGCRTRVLLGEQGFAVRYYQRQ